MPDNEHPGRVEDYTKPFLVSFGVLIFFGLWMVWVIWGLIAMIASSFSLDRSISVVGVWSAKRRAARGPQRWR